MECERNYTGNITHRLSTQTHLADLTPFIHLALVGSRVVRKGEADILIIYKPLFLLAGQRRGRPKEYETAV